MAEVLFYHLTESTLEDALPGLLERSVDRGWRAVVQTGTEERRDALDRICGPFATIRSWRMAPIASRIPPSSPILLTTGDGNPNEAQIRFLVDGAVPPDISRLRARRVPVRRPRRRRRSRRRATHWKTMKDAGHAVTYWQQTPDRRWERKA